MGFELSIYFVIFLFFGLCSLVVYIKRRRSRVEIGRYERCDTLFWELGG